MSYTAFHYDGLQGLRVGKTPHARGTIFSPTHPRVFPYIFLQFDDPILCVDSLLILLDRDLLHDFFRLVVADEIGVVPADDVHFQIDKALAVQFPGKVDRVCFLQERHVGVGEPGCLCLHDVIHVRFCFDIVIAELAVAARAEDLAFYVAISSGTGILFFSSHSARKASEISRRVSSEKISPL